MQKAKRNVEKYYAVVGVLEEMNKTLTVLEHYIPRFFAGASDIYQGRWPATLDLRCTSGQLWFTCKRRCARLPEMNARLCCWLSVECV